MLKELGKPETPDPVRRRPAGTRPALLPRRVQARAARLHVRRRRSRKACRRPSAGTATTRSGGGRSRSATRPTASSTGRSTSSAWRRPPSTAKEPGIDVTARMPDAGGPSSETHAAMLAAPRPAPRARRRVLVTGAAGMLGSDLGSALAAAGLRGPRAAEVRSRHRRREGGLPGAPRACARRRRQLRRVHEGRRLRDRSARLRGQRRRPSRNLADACGHVGAQLVQISTDFVFDGAKGAPYTRGRSGASAVRVRPHRSAPAKRRRCACPAASSCAPRGSSAARGWNFVEAILKQVEAGKPRLSVVVDQVGRPTATTDLSEAIVALLEAGASGHLPLRQPRGRLVERVRARDPLARPGARTSPSTRSTSASIARPAQRPPYSVLDTGKYERLTGRPIRHFREPLAEYLLRRARPEA